MENYGFVGRPLHQQIIKSTINMLQYETSQLALIFQEDTEACLHGYTDKSMPVHTHQHMDVKCVVQPDSPSYSKTKTDPSTIFTCLPAKCDFFLVKHMNTQTQIHVGWQDDWGLSARQGDGAICPSKGLIQPKAQATVSSIFLTYLCPQTSSSLLWRWGEVTVSHLSLWTNKLSYYIQQPHTSPKKTKTVDLAGNQVCKGTCCWHLFAGNLSFGMECLSLGGWGGVFTGSAGWKMLATKKRHTDIYLHPSSQWEQNRPFSRPVTCSSTRNAFSSKWFPCRYHKTGRRRIERLELKQKDPEGPGERCKAKSTRTLPENVPCNHT